MPSLQLFCPESGDAGDVETAFKIVETPLERREAFRLVYRAYTRSGLIEENPFEMRVTPFHLLDTTDMFIALRTGEIISTVSLVSDGELGLPMDAIYRDEVTRLRDGGVRVAEVSSLADRRRQMSRTLPVFVQLMRLMVQAARRRGIEQLLVAVHPRHASFYRRFLSFELLGQEKSYPSVRNNPAVALQLDFAKIDRHRPANYESFFGEPLPEEQLRRRPISIEERRLFGPAAAFGGNFTLVGASDECQVAKGRAHA